MADVCADRVALEMLEERIRLAALAGADAVKLDADALLAGQGTIGVLVRAARESHALCFARCRSVEAIASAVGCGIDAIEIETGALRSDAVLDAAAACAAAVVLGASGAPAAELRHAIERLGRHRERTLTMLASGAPSLVPGAPFWGHTGPDLDPIRAAAAVIRGAAAIERPFARPRQDDDAERRVTFHDLVLGIRAEESWRLRAHSPRPNAA